MNSAPTVKSRIPKAKANARRKRKKAIAGSFLTKLEKMRSQIQTLRALNLAEDKRIERLKNDATLMERLEAENKAALERYRTTFTSLDRERKAFENLHSRQRTGSLKALNNKIEDIEKVNREFAVYRGDKAKAFKAAEITHDNAKQEWEAAKRHYDEQQINYQTLLNYQQETENKFVELRSLIDQVEKQRNHRHKYFLNEDFKVLLGKTKLKPYIALAAELTKAFYSLDSAMETFAEKEAAFDKAKAAAECLKSELEMLDQTRREKILAKL